MKHKLASLTGALFAFLFAFSSPISAKQHDKHHGHSSHHHNKAHSHEKYRHTVHRYIPIKHQRLHHKRSQRKQHKPRAVISVQSYYNPIFSLVISPFTHHKPVQHR